jgi:hypothetical protein
MEKTTFLEVYIRFLSKIEDEYLASLEEEELHFALYPLLLSAINSFDRVAEHSLRKRNDTTKSFEEKLTENEVEVLAVLMRPEWLQRYINSSRKIEQQYYDAGIKTYSPNENLRNLIVLYQQYLNDARKALAEYNYATVSVVGNFSGLQNTGVYTPTQTIRVGDENDPLRQDESE